MPSLKECMGSEKLSYVFWALLGAGIVGLIVTGIPTVDISEGVEMIFKIVSAVSTFILFITKDKKKE